MIIPVDAGVTSVGRGDETGSAVMGAGDITGSSVLGDGVTTDMSGEESEPSVEPIGASVKSGETSLPGSEK